MKNRLLAWNLEFQCLDYTTETTERLNYVN